MIALALTAPYSQEAEQACLGAMMINPRAFWQVSPLLTGDDFFLTRNGMIFKAIARLMERHDAFDYVLLAEELKAMKVFEDIGGHGYIMKLYNDTPTHAHAVIYAELVKRTAVRRKMLEASDKMKALALNEEINLHDVLASAETTFIALARHRDTSHMVTVGDAMDDTDVLLKERMELYRQNPDYIIGTCTGIRDLDKHLDGLQIGITTLAASTGMGKTAAALSIALNASRIGNQHAEPLPAAVHVFSGEMTQAQINFRLLSMKSGIPMERLMRGELDNREYREYQYARQELTDLHALTFESGKQLTVMEISNRVRELVNSQQLDLFIIDGLMQINGLRVDNSPDEKFQRYQEQSRRDTIEYILNELEYIAMTYKIPFLLTHQVSRATKDRADKRPQINDMAEASFVEWKSSVILGVYRDMYYNTPPNPDDLEYQESEILILKNRHGSTGMVRCIYEAKRTLFANGTLVQVDLNP